jgi:hypothetical protein
VCGAPNKEIVLISQINMPEVFSVVVRKHHLQYFVREKYPPVVGRVFLD